MSPVCGLSESGGRKTYQTQQHAVGALAEAPLRVRTGRSGFGAPSQPHEGDADQAAHEHVKGRRKDGRRLDQRLKCVQDPHVETVVAVPRPNADHRDAEPAREVAGDAQHEQRAEEHVAMKHAPAPLRE